MTLTVGAAFFLSTGAALAVPIAVAPYTLGTFKGIPPSGATMPDDIAVSSDGADLWVGYGNGVDTFGKGGPSNLVEYDIASGAVLQNLTIPGHLDGLKINPDTGEVWATQNEDGNPTLTIVNPKNGKFETFPVKSSSDHRWARRPRLCRTKFSIHHRLIAGRYYDASDCPGFSRREKEKDHVRHHLGAARSSCDGVERSHEYGGVRRHDRRSRFDDIGSGR